MFSLSSVKHTGIHAFGYRTKMVFSNMQIQNHMEIDGYLIEAPTDRAQKMKV